METLVRAICKRENLRAEKIGLLRGGQVNHVFLVDNRYVVRIGAREGAFGRLRSETELLQRLAGDIPVPKICTLGQYENHAYQVQEFVNGEQLHHIWLCLSPEQKDKIVYELAVYLKALHERTFQRFGYCGDSEHYDSWLEFYEDRLYSTLEEVQALDIHIPPVILQEITNYFERHKQVLQEGIAVLVHGDLWLGNILVKDGKISAILDFEFSIQAPRDYELLLMEQFCLYPNDYVEENNEIYTTADFADYLQLLKKHYCELFEVRNLRERLNLYHILYSLRAYIAWRETQIEATDKSLPIQPVAKVLNFLSEQGTKMVL